MGQHRPTMIQAVLCVLMPAYLLCASCGEPTEQQVEAIKTEVNAPEEFLPLIREYIRRDTMELMKGLCHPDPNRIRYTNAYTVCNIRSDDMVEIDKCRHWFGNSSLDGQIRISGDTAFVPAQLGNGERHPLIILEREGDQWYLVGMEWKV